MGPATPRAGAVGASAISNGWPPGRGSGVATPRDLAALGAGLAQLPALAQALRGAAESEIAATDPENQAAPGR